jgi:hypothetical protein
MRNAARSSRREQQTDVFHRYRWIVRLRALRAADAAASGVSASAMISREADNDASAAYSDQFAATANVLMATARLRKKAADTTESVETVKDS